ncbi:hypothetical protein ACFSJW_07520 [Flavobacterium artemisiae]|uniref:DKNYY family protein n=1 Tax=Flavobacterium artemisiae TaxID=2126556 RepID=A0ABW4HCC8_9FLAO
MNRYLLLIIAIGILFSCDAGRRNPLPSECIGIDPCEFKDVSVIDIQNADFANIYFKYGYSNTGKKISSFSGNGVISSHSQYPNGIALNNTMFNHIYFYSTPQMNPKDSIGSFIYRNNQPTNVTICKLKVLVNGNFSADDSRIKIIRSREFGSIKYAQHYTYNYLIFNDANSQINFNGVCGVSTVLTSPANYFHHLYFYSKEGNLADENNVFSKIIYKNTRSEKININNIVVR